MRSKKGEEAEKAARKAEKYYDAHPNSPSALLRPKIDARSGTWVALYGRNVEDGIIGLGPTIEAALRAFDLRYRDARPSQPSSAA